MKEGLEVKEGKVELMVLVTTEKEKLIIHGLGNLCVCQIVMPKKYQHQQKNKCYRRRVWGLKKIKFSVEVEEVPNQLTGTVESDETAGYPQLKKCEGFELLRCIPNCKVLESIEVVMSAKNLKAAAVKGNFTSVQYKDPYLLFPYSLKPLPSQPQC